MDGTIDSRRLIIPGLSGLYDAVAPLSYAFLRFCFGVILMPHGYSKLFSGAAAGIAHRYIVHFGLPAPLAWGYAVGLLEFVGAAMLAVGLLTRPVALLLTIEMLVVAFAIHIHNGYVWVHGGVEYPLLLLVVAITILLRGGGRYSLDHAIGREF